VEANSGMKENDLPIGPLDVTTNANLNDPMRLYGISNSIETPTFNLLPNIQLKWFELPANGSTSRTLPPSALLGHEHIYASLADTAYAFRTGITLSQLAYALTSCTVYLYTLGREAW
jgi:hypothetical protein